MAKLTNTRKHIVLGFLVGFAGAILANLLPFMDKVAGQPLDPRNKLVTCLGALLFFLATIAWEAAQYLRHRRVNPTSWRRANAVSMDARNAPKPTSFRATTRNPQPYPWLDTFVDILAGNIAFLLPWIVITLGAYAGNVLRP